MASILQRTCRHRDRNLVDALGGVDPNNSKIDDQRSPCSPQALAALPLYKIATHGDECGASEGSRGVQLLLKAKDFHLTTRGFQETSGFRYISNLPKR